MFIFYSDNDQGDTLPVGSTSDLFSVTNLSQDDILSYDGSHFTNTNILSGSNIDLINIDPNNLTGTIPYSKLPNLAEITLSGDAVPPYISSITPITPTGTQEIEIFGEYFSPITQLNIPGVTVNNLEVRSPNKIIANISKSDLIGNKIITLANGANTNQIWAEGIKSIDVFADPYWANVSLFVRGDGDNNSTNIVDSSLNPKNINIFGDTKISTIQSKYGGPSIYFDGAGDYLIISNINLAGDFTIEFWIYSTSLSGTRSIIHVSAAGSNNGLHIYSNNSNLAVDNGLAADYAQAFFTLNTWHHIAVCRAGSNLRIFGNGNLMTTRPAQSYGIPNQVQIGRFTSGGVTNDFIGYLNSLRLSNIARYSTNFNPETDTYLN